MFKVLSQKSCKRAFAIASLGLSLILLLAISLAFVSSSSSLPTSNPKDIKKDFSYGDIKNVKSSYFQFMKKVYVTQEMNKA